MSTYALPGISIDYFSVEVNDITGESTITSNLLLEPVLPSNTARINSLGLGNPGFLAAISRAAEASP